MSSHEGHQSVVWTSENGKTKHWLCSCGGTLTLVYKGIREATEFVPGVDDSPVRKEGN